MGKKVFELTSIYLTITRKSSFRNLSINWVVLAWDSRNTVTKRSQSIISISVLSNSITGSVYRGRQISSNRSRVTSDSGILAASSLGTASPGASSSIGSSLSFCIIQT